MERKRPFVKDEYYHLYTRGVERRKIFMDKNDYNRFLALLYLINQKESINLKDILKHKTIEKVFEEDRGKSLVYILNYSLMQNHFHLIIQENEEGGISKFMMKLLTAYSMYFNIKYKRSGPLFVRPFRSSHIDDENYLLYVFSYVHLNPLDLFEKDWKENGLRNIKGSKNFLLKYKYGAYQDFFDFFKNKKDIRLKSKIIDFSNVPEILIDVSETEKFLDTVNLFDNEWNDVEHFFK